jgi:hypothetical protein
MTPNRILPDLQCSLLCEEIRQEMNGNFILIGVVNFLRVPQVPITAGRLLFFNRWTAGYGEFTGTVRLIAADQTTLLGKCDVRFSLPDPAAQATNVAVFGNITFNVAGIYFVEVLVDDVMKVRYPLPLVVAPPANPNPPPPSQPPPA